MKKLTLHEPLFYAHLDEKSFFGWLDQLGAVESYVGTSKGLELVFRDSMGHEELLDLMAWMTRYGLDLRPLREFCSPENEHWLKEKDSFWYPAMFGPD